MSQVLDELQPFYLQSLTQPNSLQKKCLKPPLSIFPFLELPNFSYSFEQTPLIDAPKQVIQFPQKFTIRSRSVSPKKKKTPTSSMIYLLQQTELKDLFQNPIYTFSKRLSRVSNKNFANIKVFPEQSIHHDVLKDNVQEFFQQKQEEQNLSFESRFQSGNLGMAVKSKRAQDEYYLLLTKDFNTAMCTQWFFFRVLNKKKQKCTFHILNFFKSYSSFQFGMQICVSSKRDGYKWRRAGQNILYRKTNIRGLQKQMYSLSFTYQFQSDKDITFFSYSYPYTYSKLDHLLFNLEQQNSQILKRRPIGSSTGGNSIDLVTITNFKVPSQQKKIIVITARVHPGQTPSSFVMQGILRQLIESTLQMQNVRQSFIFKLVPMLNPDGVINGNYRCNLTGFDLNRIWNCCDKDKFPEIYSVKKTLQNQKKPFLFIDLHAHSKKKGAFMYGCNIKNNPFLCRQIPFILWKKLNEFNYFQCNFSTSSHRRQGTARMVMFKELGVSLSYTMEHSFCGPLKSRSHFTVLNYIDIGRNLISTVQRFYANKRKNLGSQIEQTFSEFYLNKELVKVGEHQDNESSSDSELQAEFEVDLDPKNKEKKNLNLKLKQKSCGQVIKDIPKTQNQSMLSRFNFTRSSSYRQKAVSSQFRLFRKQKFEVPVPKIGLNINDFFKESQKMKPEFSDCTKDCQIQINKYQKQEFFTKRDAKPGYRYSEEEVNNLTYLFLPSVTSSSYKKYNKLKTQNKSIVQVGRKFLQNAGILKEQIRSVLKSKIEFKNSSKGNL